MNSWSLVAFFLAMAQSSHVAIEPVRIPHYKEVLAAQFACDKDRLAQFHWDPARTIVLAPKAWSVVADLQLSERKASPSKRDPRPSRRFDLRFRGLAYFECGEPAQGLDLPSGKEMHFLPVLVPAWGKPQFLNESGDEDPATVVEGWPNFISNLRSTDLVVAPDTMGYTCLADVKDVLRDPHTINLDKLCAGESREKREFTRKEIERAVALWKVRESGIRPSDKKPNPIRDSKTR